MLQNSTAADAVYGPLSSGIMADRLDSIVNVAADYQKIQNALEASMVNYAYNVSRNGFSVSRNDIDQIGRARDILQEKMDLAFSRIQFISEQRRSNLIHFQDWAIVSLGEDCFSRTVLTQWGLKPFAELGEKTTPFDLSVHRLYSIAEILDRDFEGYVDTKYFQYHDNVRYCRNNLYNVLFNHEVGPEYFENNFQKLIEIYTRRITNFRDVLTTPKHLAFVLHVMHARETDGPLLDRIYSLVRRATNRSFRMIVVRTTPGGEPFIGGTLRDRDYSVIDVTYPVAGYIWHDPTHCFSQLGHDFEFDVVEKVKMALR